MKEAHHVSRSEPALSSLDRGLHAGFWDHPGRRKADFPTRDAPPEIEMLTSPNNCRKLVIAVP
jgi:hypothetical protein